MIEIEIDGKKYKINKLDTEARYNLYLRCISVLAVVFKSMKKETFKDKKGKEKIGFKPDVDKLNIDQITEFIINKMEFEYVISYLTNISENSIALSYEKIKELSPLVIIELFIHVIKDNCAEEIAKKDFGSMLARIVGSENFLADLLGKAS